jgi:prepilin-type N-terminal cleavage/methylation domain-containing protein
MNRRGFTLAELMVTMLITGVLAQIALPAVTIMRRKADATRVITDFRAIRWAAFDQYASLSHYAPAGGWGEIPDELKPVLPTGFTFSYKNVQYRWAHYYLPAGLPGHPDQLELLGVEIKSDDASLMATIRGLYRGSIAFGTANQMTLVVD